LSPAQRLQAQLDAANARIAELEAERRKYSGMADYVLQAELDAANARIAELEKAYRECVLHKNDAIERADAANARAEAAEREMKFWRDETTDAHVKRAESESAALRAEVEHWKSAFSRSDEKRRAHQAAVRAHEKHGASAEGEVSALRAEVERLRREPAFELGYADGWLQGLRDAPTKQLESSLAAANALLVEVPLSALSYALAMRISHHLAAQPATAPAVYHSRPDSDVFVLDAQPATAQTDNGWPGR
jgi:hypothetical protein